MKILVCYDGSNVARDAVGLALQHAEVYGGEPVGGQSVTAKP